MPGTSPMADYVALLPSLSLPIAGGFAVTPTPVQYAATGGGIAPQPRVLGVSVTRAVLKPGMWSYACAHMCFVHLLSITTLLLHLLHRPSISHSRCAAVVDQKALWAASCITEYCPARTIRHWTPPPMWCQQVGQAGCTGGVVYSCAAWFWCSMVLCSIWTTHHCNAQATV